ncbi:MAG: hypothetical protein JW894_05100 [Bacteroidales bacterium]|nr:hypothetical protein [Bacteroidales bacterium]
MMTRNLKDLTDKELESLINDEKEDFGLRKDALQYIKKAEIIYKIAETSENDWIRLEAATLSNNRKVLKNLELNQDKQIKLQAAVELKDQEMLKQIAEDRSEDVNSIIALNNISDKNTLEKIALNGASDKIRTEAAIRVRDTKIIKKLATEIHNDWLRYKLCLYVNDLGPLQELANSTSDKRLQSIINEILEVINPANEEDID